MKGAAYSRGVYFDRSTKGEIGKQHHSYRAEVVEDGRRIRRRFCTYEAAQEWVSKMTGRPVGRPGERANGRTGKGGAR